jgi:hypothetical protein
LSCEFWTHMRDYHQLQIWERSMNYAVERKLLMRRPAAPTVRPVRLNLVTPAHDSELKTQD